MWHPKKQKTKNSVSAMHFFAGRGTKEKTNKKVPPYGLSIQNSSRA